MKRPNNQKLCCKGSIFIITLLAGIILGIVLLGLITALFVVDKPATLYQPATSFKDDSLKSTYFVDHFVNYGGEIVRIPNHFCKAIYDFSAECSPSIKYLEVNAKEYQLPIDKITSAATDFNNYIVYTVTDEEKADCAQKVYSVDLVNKTTKVLNVPDDVFVCGAIGTNIESLSPGGRFVRFEATGLASAYGSWLYDIKENKLDTVTKHSHYHEFLDTKNPDERDRYVIFEAGCDELDIVTMGADCGMQKVLIRDNLSGNTANLDDLFNRDDYATCFARNPSFSLDNKKDALYIYSGECLGAENVINNFSDVLKSLEGDNLTYTNADLNLSFKYPNNLTKPSLINLEDSELDLPLHVGVVESYDKISKQWWDECGDKCYEGGPDYINVYIFRNPKEFSPRDWVMDEKSKDHIYTNYDARTREMEEIDVAGQKAVKYSWHGLGGADVVVVPDTQHNLIYMLSAGYMGEDSSIRDDFKIVTETFKFLMDGGHGDTLQ